MISAQYTFKLRHGDTELTFVRQAAADTEAECLHQAQTMVLMDVARSLELEKRENVQRRHVPELETGDNPDEPEERVSGEVV